MKRPINMVFCLLLVWHQYGKVDIKKCWYYIPCLTYHCLPHYLFLSLSKKETYVNANHKGLGAHLLRKYNLVDWYTTMFLLAQNYMLASAYTRKKKKTVSYGVVMHGSHYPMQGSRILFQLICRSLGTHTLSHPQFYLSAPAGSHWNETTLTVTIFHHNINSPNFYKILKDQSFQKIHYIGWLSDLIKLLRFQLLFTWSTKSHSWISILKITQSSESKTWLYFRISVWKIYRLCASTPRCSDLASLGVEPRYLYF